MVEIPPHRRPRGRCSGKSTPNIQIVERVFRVLDTFTDGEAMLGVGDISRKSGFPRNSVFRMLKSMVTVGVLTHDPVTNKYRLAPRILNYGHAFLTGLNLVKVCHPRMLELRDEACESVALHVLTDNHRVCVHQVPSQREDTVVLVSGKPLPLHAGAAGKVILAFLPRERQEAVLLSTGLERYTQSTITDPELLRQNLRQIRAQGFAITAGERVRDIVSVAAPILRNGGVESAISVQGPSNRFTIEKAFGIAPQVVAAAEWISGHVAMMSHL